MQTWVAIACVLIATTAAAQPPDPEDDASFMTLSVDRSRSIDTGADLTFAATTALANVEGRAFSRLTLNRRIAIPVRIARTVLLDHPVALFMVVMQHEQYGHGGRARELGAGARYQMGSPWTIDALFKGSTRFGGGASFDAAHLSVDDLSLLQNRLPFRRGALTDKEVTKYCGGLAVLCGKLSGQAAHEHLRLYPGRDLSLARRSARCVRRRPGRQDQVSRSRAGDSLLLDHCLDAVVAGPQTVNQGLGLRVARQRNRQIGVSREPRLGPRRDGQTANQSERRADFGEIGVDLTQRRFERCHANRALRSMARPGQSPDSEPGRSKSHC